MRRLEMTPMASQASATPACGCQFCLEFDNPPRTPNRILCADASFVVLPTIGAFTPGYILLMPRHHVRSFAELDGPVLERAGRIAENLRRVLNDLYGPTIVAEHGPGGPTEPSAACCDHAHWHLIPTEPAAVVDAYETAGGSPEILPDVRGLRDQAGRAYMYLSPIRHSHFRWSHSVQFGSQFVRRVTASLIGRGDQYDWAVCPFTENMLLTRMVLEQRVHDALVNT